MGNKSIMDITGITQPPISNLKKKFRKYLRVYYSKQGKLGANGEIVELDESKF